MNRSLRRLLVPLVLITGLLALSGTAEARPGSAGSKPPRTTSSGPTCGGVTVTKPDGSAWKCTFTDEFNGTSLDTSKWVVQTTAASGFNVGGECFVNSANNISEANGVLSLTVRKEAAPFTCSSPNGAYTTEYTAGTVNTSGKFSQAYGRFDVRAKFPAATVAGLQSSLWLWPTTYKYGYWPTNGEIDIAEEFSQYPDRAIPYVHYTPSFYDTQVTNNYCTLDVTQFHDYVVEWTTSTITVLYDGKVCIADNWNPAAPLTKPAPFDQPFMVALTQALGTGANAVTSSTQLPATTQVDYVRVWS